MNDTYPHAVVFNNMTDGILNLWPKTKEAMRYTHEHFGEKFDWFFKADDDTFVIVENLRLLLSKFDPSLPHYLGFRIKPYVSEGYNSGGAGYVLSRAALKMLVERLLPNITLCPDGASEDMQLGICLSKLGIVPGDSRDDKQKNTFFPFRFNEHFNGKMPMYADPNYWYYYPMKLGWEAFGENVITMHHLSPQEIRLFELLIYKVKVAKFAN
uniref:N-acetylgalactosaminide beta-1,3-galactosyltransferase n=1 Tax=Plectus sambesii TaxID=2011161 RepID=A0A914W645_9BILA